MVAPAAARSPGRRRRTSWPGRGGCRVRSSRLSSVTVMRAPEQPSGWPSAIAPPLALTISSSSPRSRMQASDWEAKASLSSTASRSSIASRRAWSTLRVAGTGPMPMMSGATPALARRPREREAVRPCPLGVPLTHEYDGRRTVVERAGVPCGDDATGPMDRSELGELLRRVVSARGPSSWVTSPTCDDLGVEVTVLLGTPDCSLVRSQRERVELLTRQAPALGDALGGLRHR